MVMGGGTGFAGEELGGPEDGGLEADGPAAGGPALQATTVIAARMTAPSIRRLPMAEIFALFFCMAATLARSVGRQDSLTEAYARWGRAGFQKRARFA
jgi:hypothetical protein